MKRPEGTARHPVAEPSSAGHAFQTMSEVVLSLAAELSLEAVLQKLVQAARRLVGARYAALGVPDAEGTGFSRFVTDGMTDELIDAIGPLPRTHGLLGAMLSSNVPYRTEDVRSHPRFWGWPAAHPEMTSFLGVPIVFKGDVIGAIYLTDKEAGPAFDAADEDLIVLLAAHAAIAMENARLFEASRELSVVEERNRLARELHDSISQTLFSLALTADAAAAMVRTDPDGAVRELERVQQMSKESLVELRALIFQLRPPALEEEGLTTTLAKHLDLLSRAHGIEARLEADGIPRWDPVREGEVFRIVQEAVNNAVRHARADVVTVRLAVDGGRLIVAVVDDGVGFDPAARSLRARRLGLTSMAERARGLDGALAIESGPGAGTTVRLEVPLG